MPLDERLYLYCYHSFPVLDSYSAAFIWPKRHNCTCVATNIHRRAIMLFFNGLRAYLDVASSALPVYDIR
jgi:hypothetical protein